MTAVGTRGRTQPFLAVLLWVAVPILANLLVALRYRDAWYVLDEWSLINQLISWHSFGAYFVGYNGHLYVVPRLVYAVQLHWIGTPDHAFIWAVFCLALLAWSYATAILLRTLGVPSLVAVAAGIMAVYFGPGSGLDTFEINLSTDLAIACSLFAAAVAVRRHPTGHLDAIAVALLLCLATSSDGGAAVSGIVFVSALILFRWSWIDAAIGLVPPVLYAGWAALTQTGPKWPASLWADIQFSVKLVLLASGGLAGTDAVGGIVVLAVSAVVLVLGYRKGVLGGTVGRSLLAGWIAALFTVGALAHTRAGLIGTDFEYYNRYVAEVAVFVLVALLPSLWATLMAYRPERRTVMGGVVAGLLA
ncbi:MAG: hypothetical protein ACLQRH_16190, partial [Acidimicrobiales bacterium]